MFSRDGFKNYLFKIGNESPGAYLNGLDNIEKLFGIDVDAEYSKDNCRALLETLQQLRKNPEKVGKKEHDIRTYASRLRRYCEFKANKGQVQVSKEGHRGVYFDIISEIIGNYKKNFTKIDSQERYKWEAVKCFQDNWNAEAEDFHYMLKASLNKTYNLLAAMNYYPRKMILKFAEQDPNAVKEMFLNLYDENLPLSSRLEAFIQASNELTDKLEEGNKKHYQDLHAISVYLTFRYPDKYYIYKRKVFIQFADMVGYSNVPKPGVNENLKAYYDLCNIVYEVVKSDNELMIMSKSRLDDKCFEDSNYRMLTMDIIHFGSKQEELENIKDEVIKEGQSNTIVKDITLSAYTKNDFLSQVFMDEERYESLVSLLERKKNIILQGPPGVGKTFAAKRLAYSILGERDDSKIQLIQFHQNYSYEDFVMGFRPSGDGFELKYGIFYNFCKLAENNTKDKYFFIIDEINRGNMSKIFGELLMLIEKGYRNTEATLSYNGMPFMVPENIYIIGMMNTADRSLALIDYALRRRFSFFKMFPAFEEDSFKEYLSNVNDGALDELINEIKELNKEISKDASLGEGFQIGHSYFCEQEEHNDNWLDEIVEYDLIPILEEYWFDDNARVEKWTNRLRGALNA